MKKTIRFSCVIILGAAIILGIFYYQAHPFLSPTYYDGIYVDLMAQAEYEAWQEAKDPSKTIYISKVDKMTSLPICFTMKQGRKTTVSTSFLHNGTGYELYFENNVLIGARKSFAEERAAIATAVGTSYDALSTEQRKAVDRLALEAFVDKQSWETDKAVLKPILDDYAAQVQALSDAARSVD